MYDVSNSLNLKIYRFEDHDLLDILSQGSYFHGQYPFLHSFLPNREIVLGVRTCRFFV